MFVSVAVAAHSLMFHTENDAVDFVVVVVVYHGSDDENSLMTMYDRGVRQIDGRKLSRFGS